MRVIKYIIFILIILIIGCKEQVNLNNVSDKSRNQKWSEDIAYFENMYLNKSKTFPIDSLSSCKTILAHLKPTVDSLSDHQIILQLSKCVAMANNGHTVIPLGFMKKIPLRFYRFSDGTYIVKTDKNSKEYLGAKVLKINSIEIEEVEEKLKPFISGINRWKKFKTTNYLNSPEILNGIGISESDSITFTILNANDTIEVTFGAKEMENHYPESWSNLYTDPADTIWQYVSNQKVSQPIYIDKMNKGVFFYFNDTEKLAYFSINGHWSKAEKFRGKIKEYIKELKTKTDYDVVIDLRYFTGGNYIIPVDLANKPPKIIDPESKVYLITSNMTFSAGLVTAARIKYYAGDKIILVGEEVGDNLKFWAESDPYKLPNAGIKIYDAKAEHDWQDNTFKFGKSFWANKFYGVPAKSMKIDKEIKLSFNDYINGEDPILNWIIKQD